MADRDDLDFTYSLIDRIFRLSLGELADFSGAKYDGDFSLSLERGAAAQARVRRRADRDRARPTRARPRLRLGTAAGLRPRARRQRGRRHALARRRMRPAAATASTSTSTTRASSTRESFGAFDAVASLGAFEHFCSPEEYRAGRQEEIYRDLFARVAGVLPDGGRFYLQTMVFGPQHDPARGGRHRRPRDSDAWYLALMGRQFPGSWLPFGWEQVVRSAEPHFALVSSVERPPRLHRDDPSSGERGSARRACASRCSSCGSCPAG